jgi:hypothetical protein
VLAFLDKQIDWAAALCQAELISASLLSSVVQFLIDCALKTNKALEIVLTH